MMSVRRKVGINLLASCTVLVLLSPLAWFWTHWPIGTAERFVRDLHPRPGIVESKHKAYAALAGHYGVPEITILERSAKDVFLGRVNFVIYRHQHLRVERGQVEFLDGFEKAVEAVEVGWGMVWVFFVFNFHRVFSPFAAIGW